MNSLIDDPTTVDPTYGIPLTPAEKTEMDARRALENSLGPVQDLLASVPIETGGLYLDQAAGGVAVLLLTTSASPDLADRVGALLPDRSRLRTRIVARTQQDLDRVVANAQQIIDVAKRGGFEVTVVTSDIPNNRVVVEMFTLPKQDDEIVHQLEQLAGPTPLVFKQGVRAVEQSGEFPETQKDSPGQLKAALAIDVNVLGSPTGDCTSGFTTKDSAGNYYLLTAGHCQEQVGSPWYHGEYPLYNFGTVSQVRWSAGGSTDVESIFLRDIGQASNLLYMERAPNYLPQHLSVIGAQSSDSVGQTVCMYGKSTQDESCGLITNNNAAVSTSKGTLFQMRRAAYSSTTGDSGAPIYQKFGTASVIAAGIHDGNSQGQYYSWIGNVTAALGQTVLTSPSFVYIHSKYDDLCVDMSNLSSANGVPVDQYGCGFPSWQVAQLVPEIGKSTYRIVFIGNNKCIDIAGPSLNDNAKAQTWDCVGVSNQSWRLARPNRIFTDGTRPFELISTYSGKCLDVTGPSTSWGVVLQQYSCVNVSQQFWTLSKY